ncbi:cell division cycle 25 homolog d isoform X2 [Hoplias malabaricus]|uniref:cell division cycle 25 homolog d isoform X2 n=1 Tax=Hoplias malabaricus TaxID=27720 RepID=UPI0034634083
MEAVSNLSPISELSSCMQTLLCQESVSEGVSSPRRAAVTPELKRPETNDTDHTQQLIETPTGSRMRAHRKLSPPPLPSLKMKRVRVKLFSKSSADSEEEAESRAKRQFHSSPGERPSYSGETETPDPASVMLFQRLRSRRKLEHTHFPDPIITEKRFIGDFSQQYVLPVECVDHQDLHCVSAQTVASLIRGQYSSVVEEFLIIDCRYPYEYQGGHIKGAVNLYTETQVLQAFLPSYTTFQTSPGAQPDPHTPAPVSRLGSPQQSSGGRTHSSAGEGSDGGSSQRKLIVFHCEFSSERGPWLCQYLRELDRAVNVYPRLLYPELYLLQGGYKHFYTCCPELCEPCDYVPMRHRDFREQLRRFSRKRRLHHRRRPITAQQRVAHL